MTPHLRALALLGLFLASVLAPIAAPAQQSSQASSTPPGGIACAYNSVLPSITTGFAGWVQCDSTGHLLISGGGGGAITSPLGSATNDTGSVAVTTGTTSNLGLLLTAPPNCAVNGTNTPWTGLTVGGAAQTGTVIACNIDLTSIGGVALGAMANYGTSPGAVKVPGVNANVTASALPTGAATAANQVLDACSGQTLLAPFSITSATQTSLVAAVSAKKIYICSIAAITGLANNINFYDVAAAGACSAAATDAVIGASSNAATNGLNLAANGGLTQGNGKGTIAWTNTANSTLCVVTSSAGPFSGVIAYVQQ